MLRTSAVVVLGGLAVPHVPRYGSLTVFSSSAADSPIHPCHLQDPAVDTRCPWCGSWGVGRCELMIGPSCCLSPLRPTLTHPRPVLPLHWLDNDEPLGERPSPTNTMNPCPGVPGAIIVTGRATAPSMAWLAWVRGWSQSGPCLD